MNGVCKPRGELLFAAAASLVAYPVGAWLASPPYVEQLENDGKCAHLPRPFSIALLRTLHCCFGIVVIGWLRHRLTRVFP